MEMGQMDDGLIREGVTVELVKQFLFEEPPAFDQPLPIGGGKAASVLLLFAIQEGRLKILLTKRSEHLRLHAGQVSLPGGKDDPADSTPFATALREAEEEIGLDESDITRLGYGFPVLTSSQYIVTVAVAVAHLEADQMLKKLTPNQMEVSDIWWEDAQNALDIAAFTRHVRQTEKGERLFYRIENTSPEVWGATAAILYRLAKRIAAHPACH